MQIAMQKSNSHFHTWLRIAKCRKYSMMYSVNSNIVISTHNTKCTIFFTLCIIMTLINMGLTFSRDGKGMYYNKAT